MGTAVAWATLGLVLRVRGISLERKLSEGSGRGVKHGSVPSERKGLNYTQHSSATSNFNFIHFNESILLSGLININYYDTN